MIHKKIRYIMFFSFMNFFIYFESFASKSTYVYCVSIKNDWHWLKDENNEYLKVTGRWGYFFVKNENKYANFQYFILDNASERIIELSKKCIQNFGINFYNPQPANYRISDWNLFAKNERTFYGGIVDVNFISSNYGSVPAYSLTLLKLRAYGKINLLDYSYMQKFLLD